MGVDPSPRASRQLGPNPASRSARPDRTTAMNPSRTTVTDAEPLDGRWMRLTFGDGAVHEVDLAGLLQAGGVFGSIRDDRELFEAVTVSREFGTIEWPGGI